MNYNDSISTAFSIWKSEVRKLMEKKEKFVLVEWESSFHTDDCAALAQEFDYNYRFNPEVDRAYFEPRKPTGERSRA